MDKDKLLKSRRAAARIELHDLAEDEPVVKLLGRSNGVYAITTRRIIHVQSPEHLDPDLEYPDAPWVQSIYKDVGSSDLFVARTILQSNDLWSIVYGTGSAQYRELMEISWSMLDSILDTQLIHQRIKTAVDDVIAKIENDYDSYTQGTSPKPLPKITNLESDFYALLGAFKRALSIASNLFACLAGRDFSGAKFHRALEWAKKDRGQEHLLTQMLLNDQRWIKTWIDVRNAVEHPSADKRVEVLGFALEPNRAIRLPTWCFFHPDYEMQRPQNLLDVFETNTQNILKLFEDLQIVLLDELPQLTFKVGVRVINEEDRDPKDPKRIHFEILLP